MQLTQGLGFEPSRARGAGAEATKVCPANLAVGSGHAVLELLGWLSKAALKKMKGKNAGGRRKNATREAGSVEAVPGDRDGQGGGEEDKQQTNCSDGRGTQEGEGDGVFVRRGRAEVAGGPAVPDGKRTGRWKWRGRGRDRNIKTNGQKTGEPADTTATTGAAVDNSSNKKATNSSRHTTGARDRNRNRTTSAAFNRNSNNSSNSSSRSANKRNRRSALPPEVVVMMTTAVVSSSAFCSSSQSGSPSSSGCSCSSICACSRSRSRQRFWSSSCPSSAADCSSDGEVSDGGDGQEGPQASSPANSAPVRCRSCVGGVQYSRNTYTCSTDQPRGCFAPKPPLLHVPRSQLYYFLTCPFLLLPAGVTLILFTCLSTLMPANHYRSCGKSQTLWCTWF